MITETVEQTTTEVAERTTPLRLSEAMRLATMQQAFGEFVADDGSRCAIGAAAAVYGVGFEELDFLTTRRAVVPVPCGHHDRGQDLWNNIIHLNDDHHMTRPEIADWLEANGL